MIYFKFKSKFFSKEPINYSLFQKMTIKVLSAIFPRANPDFEGKYKNVLTWYIECDEEDNYPNREIGLDENGKIIVWAPYKKNMGFWLDTDLTFEDFKKFGIELMSKEKFEEEWSKFPCTYNKEGS